MTTKVAVLLSGSGVYDGSEIHETVLSLLALAEAGMEYHCFAPNIDQHHVINHLNGEEMNESRNVLIESARMARGAVEDIAKLKTQDFDALMMPGGFGAAKNWTKWAFEGPDGEIDPEVKQTINAFVDASKPIVALCMSPTVISKALEGRKLNEKLTVGTTQESSPYDITAISVGMESLGAQPEHKSVVEISIDAENKIITSPCYMMDASILEIKEGISKSVDALKQMLG